MLPFISILYDPRNLYSRSDHSLLRPPRQFHPHPHSILIIFVLLIFLVFLFLVIFILTVTLSSSSSSSASPSSYHITYLVPCLPTSSSFLIILIHTLTKMAFCESVWRTRTTILFGTTLTQSIKRNIVAKHFPVVFFSAYL